MASGGPGPPLGEWPGPRLGSGDRLDRDRYRPGDRRDGDRERPGTRLGSGDRLGPRPGSGDRSGARPCSAPGRPVTLEREVGVWDTVLLEPLTEQAFIANLHQRYKHDQIYVSAGRVCEIVPAPVSAGAPVNGLSQ